MFRNKKWTWAGYIKHRTGNRWIRWMKKVKERQMKNCKRCQGRQRSRWRNEIGVVVIVMEEVIVVTRIGQRK